LLLALWGMVHRRRRLVMLRMLLGLVVHRRLVMLRMLLGLVHRRLVMLRMLLGLVVHRRLVMLRMLLGLVMLSRLHGLVARHLGECRLRGVGRLGIFIIFIKIPFPLDIFLFLLLAESALLLSLGY